MFVCWVSVWVCVGGRRVMRDMCDTCDTSGAWHVWFGCDPVMSAFLIIGKRLFDSHSLDEDKS